MRAIQWARSGRKGKMRNEVTMIVATPAARSAAVWAGGDGGGIRLSWRILVALAAGIIRGRFSGFEKNAKTRGSGKGAQCSNSR
jgi:hypothetical protein